MKVIGAGFGRTGTLSLKAALEELGFGPCYHMVEVMRHTAHAKVWAERGEGRPVDWKALFNGYQATVDWPACTYYQELMKVFPDAKVLLSVRDPEKWYESVRNTIFQARQFMQKSWARFLMPGAKIRSRMMDSIIWDGTFSGRLEDRQYAIEVFNRHIEEVKRYVPPERLLVFDVKEGWEPLCRFLGVPVPNKPFPRLNDTVTFQQRIKNRVRLMGVAAAVVVALIGLGLFLALR